MTKLSILLLFFFYLPAFGAWTGDGDPIKYISSCELDLNKDDSSDMVLLIETIQGRELIAILREKVNLKTFSLWKGAATNKMHLTCNTNQTLVTETQTAAAKNPGKTHQTNGAMIQLAKAESGSIVFFWEKSNFKQVSTAD